MESPLQIVWKVHYTYQLEKGEESLCLFSDAVDATKTFLWQSWFPLIPLYHGRRGGVSTPLI